MRLADRFSQWPFSGGPEQLTAAQALLLVEALKEPGQNKSGPASKIGPKLPKNLLKQIAGVK